MAWTLLEPPEMQRILVILRGPIDVKSVRSRFALDDLNVTVPHAMAVCHVLPDGADGLHDSIRAQREITAALREALGSRAEDLAVLVAYDREGYRVDDCAREWGATIVRS